MWTQQAYPTDAFSARGGVFFTANSPSSNAWYVSAAHNSFERGQKNLMGKQQQQQQQQQQQAFPELASTATTMVTHHPVAHHPLSMMQKGQAASALMASALYDADAAVIVQPEDYIQVQTPKQWTESIKPQQSSPQPQQQQPLPHLLASQQQAQQQQQQQQQQQLKNKKRHNDIEKEISQQNLYKTELCRSFEETGACRYGTKCQFAHGEDELRPVIRHPKYKTEICRTFHSLGHCPYGKRCRFIHTREDIHSFAANMAANPLQYSDEDSQGFEDQDSLHTLQHPSAAVAVHHHHLHHGHHTVNAASLAVPATPAAAAAAAAAPAAAAAAHNNFSLHHGHSSEPARLAEHRRTSEGIHFANWSSQWVDDAPAAAAVPSMYPDAGLSGYDFSYSVPVAGAADISPVYVNSASYRTSNICTSAFDFSPLIAHLPSDPVLDHHHPNHPAHQRQAQRPSSYQQPQSQPQPAFEYQKDEKEAVVVVVTSEKDKKIAGEGKVEVSSVKRESEEPTLSTVPPSYFNFLS